MEHSHLSFEVFSPHDIDSWKASGSMSPSGRLADFVLSITATMVDVSPTACWYDFSQVYDTDGWRDVLWSASCIKHPPMNIIHDMHWWNMMISGFYLGTQRLRHRPTYSYQWIISSCWSSVWEQRQSGVGSGQLPWIRYISCLVSRYLTSYHRNSPLHWCVGGRGNVIGNQFIIYAW